jgi:undecaprenyl-diphosphatase
MTKWLNNDAIATCLLALYNETMNNVFETIRSIDFSLYQRLFLLGQSSSFLSYAFYFFAKYGIVLFFLSFIYLISRSKIKAFLCSFLAMAIAGFFDLLISTLWKRPGPFVSHASVINIHLQNLNLNNSSFPSSHTYIAFGIAMSVFLYGHKKLGSLLFLLAVLVAVGRVGTGLHYPSDVIGGAMIGSLSGVLAYLVIRNAERDWK